MIPRYGACFFAGGLLLVTGVMTASESAAVGIPIAYLDAVQGQRWPEAVTLATAATAADPRSPRAWSLAGLALTYAGREREGVDAFVRARILGQEDDDRAALYAQARALASIKAYVQAEDVLVHLAERFPYSRLAARDESLRLAIRARLGQPVAEPHLAWYQEALLRAQADRLPGLVVAYAEEYAALALLVPRAVPALVTIEEATAWIALGDPAQAARILAPLPPATESWRAGVAQATAAVLSGRDASAIIATIVSQAQDPAVRAAVLRLHP